MKLKVSDFKLDLVFINLPKKFFVYLCSLKKPLCHLIQNNLSGIGAELERVWCKGEPGDFGGNAHRGTRWHSMQRFGGPFHSKITWAGTGLIEGCNKRKCVLVICTLKWSPRWRGFRKCIEFVRDCKDKKYMDLKLKLGRQRIWLWGKKGRQNLTSRLNLIGCWFVWLLKLNHLEEIRELNNTDIFIWHVVFTCQLSFATLQKIFYNLQALSCLQMLNNSYKNFRPKLWLYNRRLRKRWRTKCGLTFMWFLLWVFALFNCKRSSITAIWHRIGFKLRIETQRSHLKLPCEF